MQVQHAAEPSKMVRYYGADLSWDRQTDTCARFKVEMYCPDPHMYGDLKEAVLFSSDNERSGLNLVTGLSYPLAFNWNISLESSDEMRNEGNATAYPVYRFRGDTDGITIKAGDSVMTYGGKTAADTELMIDTFTGEVRYGLSDRSYLLTSRDWITIPPKSAITPYVDFVASPETEDKLQVYATWRDAYL